jgi:hypothetical protein
MAIVEPQLDREQETTVLGAGVQSHSGLMHPYVVYGCGSVVNGPGYAPLGRPAAPATSVSQHEFSRSWKEISRLPN